MPKLMVKNTIENKQKIQNTVEQTLCPQTCVLVQLVSLFYWVPLTSTSPPWVSVCSLKMRGGDQLVFKILQLILSSVLRSRE